MDKELEAFSSFSFRISDLIFHPKKWAYYSDAKHACCTASTDRGAQFRFRCCGAPKGVKAKTIGMML